MNLYLDDDTAGNLLVQLLRRAGHDVQIPGDTGLRGQRDPVHVRHAIRENRVSVSRNYRDFEDLHELIREALGGHPGILVIRQDNDPKRDLKPRDIVRAIANLEAAAIPVRDQYIVLNHWR